MTEDKFNWQKDPTLKIGEKEIANIKNVEMDMEKSKKLTDSNISEKLADLSFEASLHIAKQKDKLIWKASKQKAEAIVFANDNELQQIEEGKFTTSEKYAICDKIAEVHTYFGENPYWIEIPAFAHRIAEETESYEEFKREMQLQSPKGEIE